MAHHYHEAASQNDPCQYPVLRYPNREERAGGSTQKDFYPCNAPWASVLHPPNQYRHWCSICEAGGDHD